MKTIVLLSGGIDSSVVLATCISERKECHALSFEYGQRHSIELEYASRIAVFLGASSHTIVHIDPKFIFASSLTGNGSVPKDVKNFGIPSTYVPGRNTIFFAYALSLAESIGAKEIALGINAVDYSGYPDCRPEWLDAARRIAHYGTKAGVEGNPVIVYAPLISMTKVDIVRKAIDFGIDLSSTISCYDPVDGACLRCDACRIREEAIDGVKGLT